MSQNPSNIHGQACVQDPTTLSDADLATKAGSPQSRSAEMAELQHQFLALRSALGTRGVIGRAQGVLMERFGIDAEGAFRLLVELSRRTHLQLWDVAARLDASTTTSSAIPDVSRQHPRDASARKHGR